MSISDGFNFWLGRALAELAIGVGVFFALVAFVSLMLWLERRR